MIRPFLPFILALVYFAGHAQVRIDSSFAFQTNPAKKYSIYVPSSYNPAVPNELMVGFHPFNIGVWDAKAWCDTLLVFSETNNLILVCPDGGTNGTVTDPIDYDFTTALIDSIKLWYNIDTTRVYAMGFSVGGVATYEYGFNNSQVFGGFIPIGAAVSGPGAFPGIIANSQGKPYYLVHGANDAPAVRYTPMLDGLDTNCAIVNSILMPGVGHTINFTNRNQILADAYHWVDSVNQRPDTVNLAFGPIAPGNGANITIQGFTDRTVNFLWNQDSFGQGCVQYELLMDDLTGDFSTPIYSIVPGNMGSDTSITLNYHVLDSLLQSQGVLIGNTFTIKWAIAATYYGRFTDTSKSFLLYLRHERIGFNLITPAHNNTINLTKGGNTFFDWQDMLGSGITYELLMDTIGGDFSNPIMNYTSATGGTSSLLTKSHPDLYFDLLFEQNYAVGDTLHLIWNVRASDANFSEFATSSRILHLRRGDLGFELISPVENTVLLSRQGVTVTFLWDSVPLPGYTYEVIIDTVNGDFTNPATAFASNSSGNDRRFFAPFEVLDSVLNVFNVPYGDTADAKWTVKATSTAGEFFAFMPFDVKIFRDFPKGISTSEAADDIRIFPVPAHDYLVIQTGKHHAQSLLTEWYDISGKLVYHNRKSITPNASIHYDLNDLAPGTYLMRLYFEEGTTVHKVVIE